ncbi:MAG: excinuclease ABC subunit UvrA, partial [Theionarchaea archaeon]|nr:excinuclease ABC subunit UvrA [Theionarchaea archaeon]
DVYVPCEVCKGKRFNKDTLSIRYKEKNIAEVMDMGVEEALTFFENIPTIKWKLKTLYDVGMGYIKLGQPATTLSGGEAQRVKLTKELSKRGTGNTLYILDEPTTGLHFDDIKKLLKMLKKLVKRGNTVVVIEHNLDVIKTADYIVDLGPEGGEEGGYIVAEGTPEVIAQTDTHTGRFLKKVLEEDQNNFEAVKDAGMPVSA